MNTITKRLLVYISGLFLLAFGIGFSIRAELGVSPVSSLAYALALITPYSVGMMTLATNIVFLFIQMLLGEKLTAKKITIQLLISVLFWAFMDGSLTLITRLLPVADNLAMQIIYLVLSLFIIALALLLYFTARLPMLPYDALTYVISARFRLEFSKAKITSDLLNVMLSAILCLSFIRSFGSIGIGTFISAYFIGKITGAFIKKYQPHLKRWIFG